MSDIKLTARFLMKKRGKRMFLLWVFAGVLYLSCGTAFLPCLLCLFYSPQEILSEMPVIGVFLGGTTSSFAAFAVSFLLSVFFLTAAQAVSFVSLCESMFIPNAGLIPPENMLTLKNGARFFCFRLLYFGIRLKNSIVFFVPSVIGAAVLIHCLKLGADRNSLIVMGASLAALIFIGIFFFRL